MSLLNQITVFKHEIIMLQISCNLLRDGYNYGILLSLIDMLNIFLLLFLNFRTDICKLRPVRWPLSSEISVLWNTAIPIHLCIVYDCFTQEEKSSNKDKAFHTQAWNVYSLGLYGNFCSSLGNQHNSKLCFFWRRRVHQFLCCKHSHYTDFKPPMWHHWSQN